MIAPEYQPVTAYEAPVGSPYRLRLSRVSTGELMAIPEAWAIVTAKIPSIKFIVGAPSVKMLLGNMTVLDFGMFGVAPDPAVVAEIDAELAKLPMRESAR